MATTTEKTELSDIDYARWFLTLRLFSDDFNVDFLQSVVNTEEPTEKQLTGLNKCVVGLKLREKIGKYDIYKHECFFNEEIDFVVVDPSMFVDLAVNTPLYGRPMGHRRYWRFIYWGLYIFTCSRRVD